MPLLPDANPLGVLTSSPSSVSYAPFRHNKTAPGCRAIATKSVGEMLPAKARMPMLSSVVSCFWLRFSPVLQSAFASTSASGVARGRIITLQDDLAENLRTAQCRCDCPAPGWGRHREVIDSVVIDVSDAFPLILEHRAEVLPAAVLALLLNGRGEKDCLGQA